MSDLIGAVSTEVFTIAKNAFGFEPTVNTQRRSTNARIDWRKMIADMEMATMQGKSVDNNNVLTPPFTILDFGKWIVNTAQRPTHARAYDIPYSLYLVDKLQNEKLSDMEAAAQTFLEAMSPGHAFTNFLVYEFPVLDSSPDNPANAIFLAGGYQLLCTSISGTITVGELMYGLSYSP